MVGEVDHGRRDSRLHESPSDDADSASDRQEFHDAARIVYLPQPLGKLGG